MKKYTRGFTLIELLVVIAIIGILSSIILVSLNQARLKGQDAKVMEQLQGLRSGAELYYSDHNHYGVGAFAGVTCTGGMWSNTVAGIGNLVAAANYYNTVAPLCATDGTGTAGDTPSSGNNGATAWAAWHALNDTTNGFFCVDSTGQSKKELTGFTVPTAANPKCQ